MSADKHTPGPWVIGGSLISNGRTPVVRVLHNGNGNPSNASDYHRDAPRWIGGADANAALIAAAPELLAALRSAEAALRYAAQESAGRVRSEIVGGWLYHADQCRAAVAAATGGDL